MSVCPVTPIMEPGNRSMASIVGVRADQSETRPEEDLRAGSQKPAPEDGEYWRGRRDAEALVREALTLRGAQSPPPR